MARVWRECGAVIISASSCTMHAPVLRTLQNTRNASSIEVRGVVKGHLHRRIALEVRRALPLVD